jgi:hypothetical protein
LEAALAWQLKITKLPMPELQHRFAPPRRWRFDMCWPERMLAVEVEGGSWVGGAHVRGARFESDCEKYCEAVLLGWKVLRVTGGMVEDGRAIALIQRAMEE